MVLCGNTVRNVALGPWLVGHPCHRQSGDGYEKACGFWWYCWQFWAVSRVVFLQKIVSMKCLYHTQVLSVSSKIFHYKHFSKCCVSHKRKWFTVAKMSLEGFLSRYKIACKVFFQTKPVLRFLLKIMWHSYLIKIWKAHRFKEIFKSNRRTQSGNIRMNLMFPTAETNIKTSAKQGKWGILRLL